MLIIGFEQLPLADEAVILSPSLLDESEVRRILSQIEFEGKRSALSMNDNIAWLPGSFVPMPVVRTQCADHVADAIRIPFRAMNLNRLGRGNAAWAAVARRQDPFSSVVGVDGFEIGSELFQLYAEWFEQFGGEATFSRAASQEKDAPNRYGDDSSAPLPPRRTPALALQRCL